MSKNKGLIGEAWQFLRVRKVWWLTPIILMLIVVGFFIIFAQSTVLSQFMYALF